MFRNRMRWVVCFRITIRLRRTSQHHELALAGRVRDAYENKKLVELLTASCCLEVPTSAREVKSDEAKK